MHKTTTNKLLPLPPGILEKYENELFNPQTRAWMRVTELLQAACSDPVITTNPEAVQFLQLVGQLSERAWGHWKVNDVLAPWVQEMEVHARRKNSSDGGVNKAEKYSPLRAQALAQWDHLTTQGKVKAEGFAVEFAETPQALQIELKKSTVLTWIREHRKSKP